MRPMEPLEPSSYPSGSHPLCGSVLILVCLITSSGGNFTVVYGFEFMPACNAELVFPNGYSIRNPFLVLFSFFAVLIGVCCGNAIRRSGARSSTSYSIIFYAYGCMMTMAALGDAVIPVTLTWISWHTFAQYIDVSITSSIAATFMFSGFADVNVIDQTSKKTRGAMLLTYVTLFVGWYFAYYGGYFALIEKYLYQYEIVVTCGIYCLCELYYLFYLGHRDGLGWVVLAGLCGAVGIRFMLAYPAFLCRLFTPFMGDHVQWFLFSDLAMLCIYKYYLANHARDNIRKSSLSSPLPTRTPQESFVTSVEDGVSVPLAPLYQPRA